MGVSTPLGNHACWFDAQTLRRAHDANGIKFLDNDLA
jgi:hypothetical protein